MKENSKIIRRNWDILLFVEKEEPRLLCIINAHWCLLCWSHKILKAFWKLRLRLVYLFNVKCISLYLNSLWIQKLPGVTQLFNWGLFAPLAKQARYSLISTQATWAFMSSSLCLCSPPHHRIQGWVLLAAFLNMYIQSEQNSFRRSFVCKSKPFGKIRATAQHVGFSKQDSWPCRFSRASPGLATQAQPVPTPYTEGAHRSTL